MMKRLSEFARTWRLFEPGDRVLCAVSGGADSVAMLYLLRELQSKLPLELCCAHYNHGIRGAEADRDEDFVRELCRTLELPFRAGRGNVPACARERKLGIEAAAREMRYAFLEACADEMGCTRIATAHNAADNAETMLLNLLRGAGLRGACGIAPRRGRIVRPILFLDRPEIEAFLKERQIPYITDSTNLEENYARNRLRRHVIAPLRELEPDFGRHLLSACTAMRAVEEYLQSLATAFLEQQTGCAISAGALAALPEPVAARTILRLVPGASRRHVSAVLALAGAPEPHGQLDLPGCRVLRQYDVLKFGAAVQELPEERELMPGMTVQYGVFSVSCTEVDALPEKKVNGYYFCFKTDAICGKISVGPRRTGDRLRLPGRGVTKTLKKLYAEARISPDERERIPVLRDAEGVLAVCGFGQGERAAASCGERAYMIEINKNAEG